MKRLLVLTTAVLGLGLAPPAGAGTYDVVACGTGTANGSWTPHVLSGYVDAYSVCPGEGVVTRMNGGTERAPNLASSYQEFVAPPGTRIVQLTANMLFNSQNGWNLGFIDDSVRWVWCGRSCTSFGRYWYTSIPLNTSWIRAQVTCFNGTGCPRTNQDGILAMKDISVKIDDPTPPSVAITGGSVTRSGWLSGDQDVQFSASDATGVQRVEIFVDGRFARAVNGGCDWTRPRPCGDITGTSELPSDLFTSDGRFTVLVRALDAGGNTVETSRGVLVDNTPPGQALDARMDGGDGWHARNSFAIGWRNPIQTAAPIGAVRYSLCPASNVGGETRDCADGSVRARDVSALSDLRVPRPGEWRLSLWLEDEAGNADRERAVSVGVLRFDDDAPTLRIAPQDDRDPTRVRVPASDATSGIAGGQVEARRDGEEAWRTLPTTVSAEGLSATLDDEKLPRGRYELRARVVDRAGNERSSQALPSGAPATRTLPLRVATRLAVGKPTRVRARDAKGKWRTRTILRVNPSAGFGRTIPLRGRLTMPGGNPLADAQIEVWERVKLPTADWRQVSIITTSNTGRFRFKALRGPSRTLRFRYPGTATIRSRSTQIDLGVRAMTSFRVTSDRVVNGEEVRFHGRLRGRQTGQTGKLLYLQVFTRGKWSTFATPRANRASGLWSQSYRFSATRGLVRYRFRVLIPRETSFPYETGRSRSLRVTVRGL